MSDHPDDPTVGFRNYLKADYQVAPKTLISGFALMLIALAKELSVADRVPLEDQNWEYLIPRIATRVQCEIAHQSDPAVGVHLLDDSDLAPGSDLIEALVPVGNRLMKYFEEYGKHYRSKHPRPNQIKED